MKFQSVILSALVVSFCTAVPIFRQQLGIIASNSNEILRLPGLTLANIGLGQGQIQQGTPFLSPFLIPQQPDLMLPQLVNFGPQIPGPFLPPQQNFPPFVLTPSQQEQPAVPVNPNNSPPNQDPAQMVPQFYPFPQGPGGQGFPYYLNYGFPPRNTLQRPQLNQKTAVQQPMSPTKGSQPAQSNGIALDPWRMTPPPDNRGDRPGRGVDVDPVVPFFAP